MPETSRRDLLIGVAARSIVNRAELNVRSAFATEAKNGLLKARREAANRRRRVINNNDGDDIWSDEADTVEKFLAVRHTPRLNTHVDCIHYCTTQGFNHFTHDTRVTQIFRTKSGNFASNNLQTFLDQETMACGYRVSLRGITAWSRSGRSA